MYKLFFVDEKVLNFIILFYFFVSQGQKRFVDSLELTFGHEHIVFVEGSYDDAVLKATDEAKFLFVYIHSNDHPNSEPFCQ